MGIMQRVCLLRKQGRIVCRGTRNVMCFPSMERNRGRTLSPNTTRLPLLAKPVPSIVTLVLMLPDEGAREVRWTVVCEEEEELEE